MNDSFSDSRPQPAAAQQLSANPAPPEENPYQSPDPAELQPGESEEAVTLSPLAGQIAVLMQQGKNGASWFYWIAGFSLVNTLIMLVSGGLFFVVGLGVTCLADGMAQLNAQNMPETATAGKVVAFVFSVAMSLVFCGFGSLAVRRWQPVFAFGMFLYLLDGLLFLAIGEMMAAAFHAYALYCMWSGFQAYRRLAVLERQLMDPLHPAGILNPHQVASTEGTQA